jgi:hypothetical protein
VSASARPAVAFFAVARGRPEFALDKSGRHALLEVINGTRITVDEEPLAELLRARGLHHLNDGRIPQRQFEDSTSR